MPFSSLLLITNLMCKIRSKIKRQNPALRKQMQTKHYLSQEKEQFNPIVSLLNNKQKAIFKVEPDNYK